MRAAPITAATTWRTLAAGTLVSIGLAAAGAGMASAHVWLFASHPAASTTTRLVSAIAPPSLLRADELFKPADAPGDATGAEVPLPSSDTSAAVPVGAATQGATSSKTGSGEGHPSTIASEPSPTTTEGSEHPAGTLPTSEPTERPEPSQSTEPAPSAEPAN